MHQQNELHYIINGTICILLFLHIQYYNNKVHTKFAHKNKCVSSSSSSMYVHGCQ